MIKTRNFRASLLLWSIVSFGGIFAARSDSIAGECNIRAQLIWGTDEEKPADKELRELDPKVADKLRHVFKWKNYLEITNLTIVLSPQMSKTVTMSPKCKLELKTIEAESKKPEDALIEVKLFGEGKKVTTKRQPIKLLQQGEYSILAGDDKEKRENAWFVVLSCPSR